MQMVLLLTLISSAVATGRALNIGRQTHLEWDNKTIACGGATFGGCCDGSQDDYYGYSSTCYNATKIATDVGGTTFGTRDEYQCSNHLTGNKSQPLFQPICCKMTTVYGGGITRPHTTFMSCLTQAGSPV